MEPIDGVEGIPKNRWKLVSYFSPAMRRASGSKLTPEVCSLCRERMGACVQCDNRNCFTAFHVTCARQMGYLSPMKSVHNDGSLKAYCEKHLPVSFMTPSIGPAGTSADWAG
jgi:NuA3 HAT complex component NTO1